MSVITDRVGILQRIEWVLNTIFHQLVTIYCFFHFWLIFSSFTLDHSRLWHIFLSTVAYFPLMAESLILYFESNVWSQKLDRKKKFYVHGTILLISTVSLTAGISFEINAKNLSGKEHFQSGHAITGLVSWLLSIISVFLGLLSANSQSFKNNIPPVMFKFVHNFLGIASFCVGIISLSLGFFLDEFMFYSGILENEQIFAVVLIAILAIWSISSALKTLYTEAKSVFSYR
ncbi:unnamed protein product [Phaedon cochleariae]|uniref:ascorbate ferrireductase (transmembrane) n=1 Tax=Phaedon cochleariae TaxID=80249 RepID=A0A9P0DUR2_PHACE|nr:unnamed protein product [Phaedon cochleariae]